ncbi:uncharacterized protein LOC143254426 isoform X2 [Tachypleus tridentatus]|uniref:uncharacterized protein LOC143254426 isoform X2 n=1 Tax=Tachypleus tridentatus TaxID=6853 RepID=UPI003FCF0EAF
MSATLVRKTLDLDLCTSNEKSGPENKEIKDALPTTKKGLKKFRKRMIQDKQKNLNKGISMAKDKKLKCIIEKLRENQQGDMVQENIKLLKRFGEMKTKADTTKQILGRMSKNQPPTQKEEQSTVFTDKDFELFEREYMLIKPKKESFFD